MSTILIDHDIDKSKFILEKALKIINEKLYEYNNANEHGMKYFNYTFCNDYSIILFENYYIKNNILYISCKIYKGMKHIGNLIIYKKDNIWCLFD